jgi:hypothetical protein
MDDIVCVSVLESVADLTRNFYYPIDIVGVRLAEAWAFDKLHHQERRPMVLAHIVHSYYVGMVQRSCRSGFPNETLASVVRRGSLGQNLDRNFAHQFEISCAIDHTHSAATDLAVESVSVAEDGARRKSGNPDSVPIEPERLLELARHKRENNTLSERMSAALHHGLWNFAYFRGFKSLSVWNLPNLMNPFRRDKLNRH